MILGKISADPLSHGMNHTDEDIFQFHTSPSNADPCTMSAHPVNKFAGFKMSNLITTTNQDANKKYRGVKAPATNSLLITAAIGKKHFNRSPNDPCDHPERYRMTMFMSTQRSLAKPRWWWWWSPELNDVCAGFLIGSIDWKTSSYPGVGRKTWPISVRWRRRRRRFPYSLKRLHLCNALPSKTRSAVDIIRLVSLSLGLSCGDNKGVIKWLLPPRLSRRRTEPPPSIRQSSL